MASVEIGSSADRKVAVSLTFDFDAESAWLGSFKLDTPSALSRGAYLSFDLASAGRLKELLAAVAVYAAGGYRALAAYGESKGGDVLRLTSQLKG